jgi:glycolate oxidase
MITWGDGRLPSHGSPAAVPRARAARPAGALAPGPRGPGRRSRDRRLMGLPASVIAELVRIVGETYVVHDPHDLRIFERDGSIEGAVPDAVVLPATREQVVAVVRLAAGHGIPVVPRGAGTGLSGGAVTLKGGIALQLSRMRRIVEIDPVTRTAIVEPGVVNADLQQAAARHGLFYAPDPSSQKACTIGGNAAENSGGPHCLYYGVTTNHVLGVEVVFADGTAAWLGTDAPDRVGLDLLGLVIGSEGTLATITRIRVRLLPLPESVSTLMAAFPTVETASQAVSDVIGHGMVPAALEMMDRVTIGAVEAHYRAGYPTDAGAVLLVEVEGLAESCAEQAAVIERILRQNEATELRAARDAAERELLWAGRKGAIGALGRIRPNYYLHDGVVPRTRLPEVLRRVGEIGEYYRLPVANVFHAGDGNLHPNILFDARDPGVLDQVERAGEEMLRAVVEMGGTLSGEHGIGIEKNAFMPWIYTPDDLEAMLRVKRVFDPRGMLNPGKIFPDPERQARLTARVGFCAEARWW